MEINIYDLQMNRLGVIDEITSFIWTRRYWSCGEFKLLVPFTERHVQLLQKNRLVIKQGGNEAAEILYLNIKKNAQGAEEIEAQGKMLVHWLDKRIVRNAVVTSDTTQNIITRLVRENLTEPTDTARKIPNLSIASMDNLNDGIVEYASEPFMSCLLAVETASKAAKLGFVLNTDVHTGQHAFRVYKGTELTADRIENQPCIFSQEFDNIYEQEYTNSLENYKSFAYVGGEDKEPRLIVPVGATSGLERTEFFVNATDVKNEGAQYPNQLAARGIAELEKYSETLNFTSAVNNHTNLKYGDDFDIGDRVTCLNKRWGIKINVRITEVEEVYQEGKSDIDITFGESLPTLLEQIRKVK